MNRRISTPLRRPLLSSICALALLALTPLLGSSAQAATTATNPIGALDRSCAPDRHQRERLGCRPDAPKPR